MNSSGPLTNANRVLSSGVFDNAGNYYVICPTHRTYYLTSMCLYPECHEPLCQECIPIHIDSHQKKRQPSVIQNIQNVRTQMKQNIEQYLQFLLNLQEQFKTPQTHLEINLEKLRQAEEQVIDIVHQIFKQYEEELRYRLSQIGYYEPASQQIIQKEIHIGRNLITDFGTKDYLSAIKFIFEKQFGERNALHQLIQPHQQDFLPEVQINNSYKDDIYESIQNYISITKMEDRRRVQFNDQENLSDSGTEPIMHLTNIPYLKEQESGTTKQQASLVVSQAIKSKLIKPNIEFADDLQQLSNKSQKLYKNLLIKDLFKSKPIMASAEDNTQNLLYIDLTSKQIKVEEMHFSASFPSRHCLIILGNDIFIIGGMMPDDTVIPQVFTLDLKTSQMEWNSNLVSKRCDFGACSLNEKYIFVCCGSQNLKESKMLQSLEKYDRSLKRWSQLSPCKIPAIGISLVCVGNRFLVKLGGIDELYQDVQQIEVYNIKKNSWSYLKVFESNGNIWRKLGARQGCHQINESQLLVFGGDIGDRQVDDCWLITMDVKEEVDSSTVERWSSTPICGDIWCPIVVYNTSLFCLMRSQTNLSQKKMLLECKSDKWAQIE